MKLSSLLRAVALTLATAGFAACASAQSGIGEVALVASSIMRCMTPAASEQAKPLYPPDMLRLKMGGLVRAEFKFVNSQDAPKVSFSDSEQSDFHDAVKAYARQLRLPCMGSGSEPVLLRQEFVFSPNDGRRVSYTTAKDAADDGKRDQLRCMTPIDGAGIFYPTQLLNEGVQGGVLMKMRFTAADKPPEASVLYESNRHFTSAVGPALERVRMPCFKGEPIEANVQFDFRFAGGAVKRRVLKDLGLPQYLSAVKPIPPGSAHFDTTTMKCPFDVRMTLGQPFRANTIEALGEDDPTRHPFLDWLGEQTLELGPKPDLDLYGQPMTIHVPCVRLEI